MKYYEFIVENKYDREGRKGKIFPIEMINDLGKQSSETLTYSPMREIVIVYAPARCFFREHRNR